GARTTAVEKRSAQPRPRNGTPATQTDAAQRRIREPAPGRGSLDKEQELRWLIQGPSSSGARKTAETLPLSSVIGNLELDREIPDLTIGSEIRKVGQAFCLPMCQASWKPAPRSLSRASGSPFVPARRDPRMPPVFRFAAQDRKEARWPETPGPS